jgi:phage major head subunit gpT-like protein
MDLTNANLASMFTAFSLMYQQGYRESEIFWRMLATLVPSSTETMTYAWMDKIPKLREWLGPRVVQNVASRDRLVRNKDFELTIAVPKNKILDDSYGIYAPLAQQMGESAAKWPDDLVGAKLIENPICFDGQNFFDTDHPVDLDDSTKGTYSNVIATNALNSTNFGKAKTRFRTFKGANGAPIGARGTLLVVPPSLEETARVVLNSSFVPRLADGASLGNGDVGMVENQWKGSAELLVIDELESDSTSTWYLLDNRAVIKPLIFQLREAPVFAYRNKPTDDNVFWNKEFVMGCEARGAADVTLPFLAVKCTA